MSVETDSLIGYLSSTGVPFRVTSTTGGTHAPGSYHYRPGTGGQGLAVDFAGLVPSTNSPALRAIFGAFASSGLRLAELFGPGDPSHDNHVHVAVPLGFTWRPAMPDDPNLPNLTDLKFFLAITDMNGTCTGYYMVSSTGEVHGWGPGAPYHGRSEVVA